MRKTLLAIVLGAAVVVAVPTAAIARTHHRGHHRHAKVRREHFGTWHDEASAPSNAPTAGMVASFNNDVLTIKLGDGSMVSGQVTRGTEIKCEAALHDEMESAEHADGDHGGRSDNGGGGDNNDRGDDMQGEQMCSTANLVPGASVADAELTLSGAGAVWNEVDLAG